MENTPVLTNHNGDEKELTIIIAKTEVSLSH